MISKKLLSTIGAKGSAEILQELAGGPSRPKKLTQASKVSEPTAYKRISQLVEAKVVEAVIVEEEGGSHKGYRLTELGEKLAKIFTEEGHP